MQDRTLASKRVNSAQRKSNRYFIQRSRWRWFQFLSIIIFLMTIWALYWTKTESGQEILIATGLQDAVADICTPILVVDLVVYLIVSLVYTGKHRLGTGKYINKKLSEIDKMDGTEFEHYLAAHFRKLGYDVTEVGGANDYGADLILRKRGKTTVVQAKRYKGHVSNTAVQEIHGARTFYKANAAMVITNSYFTKNAIALADACDVILWDRTSIKKEFGVKDGRREKAAKNTGKNGA